MSRTKVRRRKKLLADLHKVEELGPYWAQMKREGDRACAVLSATVLEALLEKILRKYMLPEVPDDLFSGHGPLASFAAKIDFAFYLGLISKSDHAELHRIRDIRNEFAHALETDLSFESQLIAQQIANLRIIGPYCKKRGASLRTTFDITVLVLTGFLIGALGKVKSVEPLPEKVPDLEKYGTVL